MSDPTTQFFEDLGQRGHEPRLENAKGTMRFDVTNGKTSVHWFVAIDKGDLTVSRSDRAADCTLRTSKEVFDRLVSGRASAVAEALRGRLSIEGDLRLLVLFRRILPGLSPAKSPTTGTSRR
jgi:predicted lipid carrier protein YhbT